MRTDAQCCTIKKQFESGEVWRRAHLLYASRHNEVCKSRHPVAASFPQSLRGCGKERDNKTFDRLHKPSGYVVVWVEFTHCQVLQEHAGLARGRKHNKILMLHKASCVYIINDAQDVEQRYGGSCCYMTQFIKTIMGR